MKKRDIELQEIKQEENTNDEKKDMNNNETVNLSEKKEEQSILCKSRILNRSFAQILQRFHSTLE